MPPPPDATATAAELAQLRDLLAKNDPQVTGKIRFWDAGSPGYRWIGIVNNRFAAGEAGITFPHRNSRTAEARLGMRLVNRQSSMA